jgi:hypothetical protein
MAKQRPTYTVKDVIASMLMLAMLTWLTVCLPIVNQSQNAAKVQTEQGCADCEPDGSNPLTNTNEEKSESGTSLFQEYLHEIQHVDRHFITLASAFKGHPSSIYIAFHPDLVVPPPDA